MIYKRVLWIRILIAIVTFIILSLVLVDWFLKEAKESSYRWHPNPIETVLFIISFITLAKGKLGTVVDFVTSAFFGGDQFTGILVQFG
jgi:flagellar basal body-associated protein FliL